MFAPQAAEGAINHLGNCIDDESANQVFIEDNFLANEMSRYVPEDNGNTLLIVETTMNCTNL